MLEEVWPGMVSLDELLKEEWVVPGRLHAPAHGETNAVRNDGASVQTNTGIASEQARRVISPGRTLVGSYGPCGRPLDAMELHGAYNHKPIRQILRTVARGVVGLRLQTGPEHGGAILSSREIKMVHKEQ